MNHRASRTTLVQRQKAQRRNGECPDQVRALCDASEPVHRLLQQARQHLGALLNTPDSNTLYIYWKQS